MDDAARSAPAEAVAHARRVLETEAAGLTTLAARLPEDFDAQMCSAFETPGARFECMLNATALRDALTCHDVTTDDAS